VKHDLPVIGVTGGIGAGKSAVAQMLGTLGTLVIDSDTLAHEELRSADVIEAIKAQWGSAVFRANGQVDRAALGSKVFGDPAELKKLENLLYPRINRHRRKIIAEHAGRPGLRAVVLDAPKLYEAGVDKECDAVLFVDADEEVRIRRVAKSRGWGPAELARREKMQIPLDKKRAMADYVVVNNHTGLDSLTPELKRILDSVVGSKPKP
jgi:dephospho-CoA kinase